LSLPWSHCFLWLCTCEWILPRRPVKSFLPRLLPRISRRSKSPLTNPRKGPGWYFFFPRLEQPVCGGPPRSNNSCNAIRTLRSGCWWCGSRYSRWTCVHQFIARSGESRTSAPISSGTRNISSRKSSAGLPVKTRDNRSPGVASTRDSSGMMRFFMHLIRSGGRLLRPFSGTARSSAWLPPSRRHSTIAHEAASSGPGVADPAAEAPFLFQFLDVDDLRTDKDIGVAR
jgi:hypothetical protein